MVDQLAALDFQEVLEAAQDPIVLQHLEDLVIEKLEPRHQHHHKVMMVDQLDPFLVVVVAEQVVVVGEANLMAPAMVEMGRHHQFQEHR